MRARLIGSGALGLALVLSLTGCFGPGEDELIAQARIDFDALVDQAADADFEVLHTLEVEDPLSESCDNETDAEHTVFVAAGTTAVQADRDDEQQLLDGLELHEESDGEERWTAIGGLPDAQRAYVDADGITASLKVDDGLLVIAVFSPCR